MSVRVTASRWRQKPDMLTSCRLAAAESWTEKPTRLTSTNMKIINDAKITTTRAAVKRNNVRALLHRTSYIVTLLDTSVAAISTSRASSSRHIRKDYSKNRFCKKGWIIPVTMLLAKGWGDLCLSLLCFGWLVFVSSAL